MSYFSKMSMSDIDWNYYASTTTIATMNYKKHRCPVPLDALRFHELLVTRHSMIPGVLVLPGTLRCATRRSMLPGDPLHQVLCTTMYFVSLGDLHHKTLYVIRHSVLTCTIYY